MDPGAGPRRGNSLEGELLVVARPEKDSPRHRGENRLGSAEDPGARAGMDSPVAPGTAGQVQGTDPGLRTDAGRRRAEAGRHGRDPDPGSAPAGRSGGDRRKGEQ